MNKTLKGIVLFTALLLPVLIFLFLKMFGKNEFEIPIYNHTEITSDIPCEDIELPHTVAIDSGSVENIYQVLDMVNDIQLKQMMRVKDRFEGQRVAIKTLIMSDSLIDIGSIVDKYQINQNWQLKLLEQIGFKSFIDCELMMEQGMSLALVDSEGKIRGYYDGNDLKDVDRLILETKILLYDNE